MKARYRWMLCSTTVVLCSLNAAVGQYDNAELAMLDEGTKAHVATPTVHHAQQVRSVPQLMRTAELVISGMRAEQGPWKVEVLDEAGHVVRERAISCSGSFAYRVDDLGPGRYVARVGNADGATVVRFER